MARVTCHRATLNLQPPHLADFSAQESSLHLQISCQAGEPAVVAMKSPEAATGPPPAKESNSRLLDSQTSADVRIAKATAANRPVSFYLRRCFLLEMAVLSVVLIAALEILNFLSNRDQGFITAKARMHYLWTYGPTLGEFDGRHGVRS